MDFFLSDAVKTLAAKSGTEPYGWLPLWVHLLDTAGIMEKLLSCWLPPAVCASAGLTETEFYQAAVFLALSHDIGKASSVFQWNIAFALPELPAAMQAVGIPLLPVGCYPDGRRTPHAMAGNAILLEYGCPPGEAAVVGAHHGKPQGTCDDPSEQIEDFGVNFFGSGPDEAWEDIWRELIDLSLARAGLSSLSELPRLPATSQFLLTGLVIMADWIASNPAYFPLLAWGEQLQGDADCQARVDLAWEKLGLPQPWVSASIPVDDALFSEQFGFAPNTVQQAVLSAAGTASEAGLYILEAPMGIGKTEAALAAAQMLAARRGCGGLFFGLPTQATANGIFKRLERWAMGQSQTAVHAIRLAHGAAQLNPEYAGLFHGTAQVAEDTAEGGLIAHEWFEGRRQALLADFVIGTVDQLLLAALRQKHVMLRHLGLSGKVVIVDECHAYDAYMNEYLDRALTWLGTYGVPVILLSATLPSQRRTEMVKAYFGTRRMESAPEGWQFSRGYPLLTWSSGNALHQQVILSKPAQTSVLIERLREEDLIHYLSEGLREGGCAGIILNTVQRAQMFADRIRRELPDAEVVVIHAHYLTPDRAEIEESLLARLGKGSTAAQRNRLIVVGTQVLEQSLDIDFDLLITDLCPMDLLLQRIGRLHRHGGRVRPECLAKARCAVLGAEDGALEKGSAAVYSPWLLLRTRMLLPETISLPEDIPDLVQNVYDDAIPENLSAEMQQARENDLKDIRGQKERARQFCLTPPRNSRQFPQLNTIRGMLDSPQTAKDSDAEAAVRDGEPSIEVLLLQKVADNTVHFLPWRQDGAQIPADRIPSQKEALLIASQRLRLPALFSKPWKVGNSILQLERQTQASFAAWQQSPVLHEELVLLLDSDLQASLSGCRLSYSRQMGLICEKEEDHAGKGI